MKDGQTDGDARGLSNKPIVIIPFLPFGYETLKRRELIICITITKINKYYNRNRLVIKHLYEVGGTAGYDVPKLN